MTPIDATNVAKATIETLTGRSCETVISCELLDQIWAVALEVIEKNGRISDFDAIALYQIDINDQSQEVQGYKCIRRYRRGDAAGTAA